MSETDQPIIKNDKVAFEEQKSQTTPTSLAEIIKIIAVYVKPLNELITTIAERMFRANQAEARFRVQMAWIAVLIVTMIVGIAGTLTYFGKLDGSTFGFLLGLVVGYVLTFIRDSIKPPAEG